MKKVVYFALVLFIAGGTGCNNQKAVVENNPPEQNPTRKPDVKNADALSYNKDIKPFFATYCVECHSGAKAKAGYNFEAFDGLMKGGKRGPAVVPGDADKSLVVRALAGQGKKMPPKMYKHQPNPEDVEMLKAWIGAGAKDDTAKVGAVVEPQPDHRLASAPFQHK
jgi:hypothetical protein